MKNTKEINTMAILENDAVDKLRKDFSFLYWERFVMIDTSQMRLGINDISYKASSPLEDDIAMLQLTCKGWLETYDARDLTISLSDKLETLLRVVNKKRTIVVFPGNGAQVIKDLLPDGLLDGVSTVEIPTERKVGSNGSVNGVELLGRTKLREAVAERKAETIIILDDVIVTGSTLIAVKDAISGRNIEFYAGALMMRSPLQRGGRCSAESGIEGYTSVIAPIVYQGISGTPPVNSLSTLMGESDKSRTVRAKYISQYVEDPSTFMDTVSAIRGKIKI